jgi:hypothetical protein
MLALAIQELALCSAAHLLLLHVPQTLTAKPKRHCAVKATALMISASLVRLVLVLENAAPWAPIFLHFLPALFSASVRKHAPVATSIIALKVRFDFLRHPNILLPFFFLLLISAHPTRPTVKIPLR